MDQVILYNQDNGIPAIVMPTAEALGVMTIMQIAIKDVPIGKPFKIINAADLPTDAPQETWVVDDAELTDGIGGQPQSQENIQQEAELNVENSTISDASEEVV